MWTLPDALRRRLTLPLPGLDVQMRMAPRPRLGTDPNSLPAVLRPAAALLLMYPHEDSWHVPLTLRGSGLRQHTSQVSLPGGRLDEGESIEEAALREAHEEVGIVPGDVDVLGRLTPLSIIVSGHLLHPVVGVTSERPRFNLATHEVERLIEIPVARLRQPEAVSWEQRARSQPHHGLMDVPYFGVEEARVWGATAMVLAEFLALIDEVEQAG